MYQPVWTEAKLDTSSQLLLATKNYFVLRLSVCLSVECVCVCACACQNYSCSLCLSLSRVLCAFIYLVFVIKEFGRRIIVRELYSIHYIVWLTQTHVQASLLCSCSLQNITKTRNLEYSVQNIFISTYMKNIWRLMKHCRAGILTPLWYSIFRSSLVIFSPKVLRAQSHRVRRLE